jgi:hypothetical protein
MDQLLLDGWLRPDLDKLARCCCLEKAQDAAGSSLV